MDTPALNSDPKIQINSVLNDDIDSTMLLFSQYTIEISYLFSDDSVKNRDTKKKWLDEWQMEEQKNLPIAIRLRFEGNAENSELKTFNLVSAIAANMSSSSSSIRR